jgi:hypothetical protein
MKNFFLRLALAAGMVVVTQALVSSTQAQQSNPPQQADEDSAPATPKPPRASTPAAPGRETSPSKSETESKSESEEALTFTGRVERAGGVVKLHDPVTRNTYRFDDLSRVQPYVGKQVKVTGKLDVNTNTIHIQTIGPLL